MINVFGILGVIITFIFLLIVLLLFIAIILISYSAKTKKYFFQDLYFCFRFAIPPVKDID